VVGNSGVLKRMDSLTLTISVTLTSFFMCMTSSMLYLRSRSETYLIDWSFASLAFLLSSLIALIGLYSESTNFLFPTIANVLNIIAHATLLSGTTKLTNNKSIPFLVIGLGILVFVLHYLDFTRSSTTARILLFYPIIISLCLGNIYFALKHMQSSRQSDLTLLVVIHSAFAIFLIVRGIYIAFFNETLQLFGNDIIQTSGSLLLLAFMFSMTLNFIFIPTWRKELELNKHSRNDYLTGWLNRRALAEIAYNLFIKSQRESKIFGAIIIDIDHFKTINDTYGHAVGDEAIKHICNQIRNCNRSYDFHFRLGGEEFLVLVDDTKEKYVRQFAHRIREKIEQTPLMLGNQKINITVSLGATTFHSTDNSWEQLLDRADKALYQAKNEGRNQVVVASKSFPTSTKHQLNMKKHLASS